MRPLGWLSRAGQFLFTLSFSSLTRRIVSLNIAGLLFLVASILYLSQFRAGLIDARAESLLVQAEIIAGAIGASATVQTNNAISFDPDKLSELKPGETVKGPEEDSALDFPINPERVAPILRRLVSPTKTRARIYDRDGVLLVDSRNLFGRGDVLRYDLPPPTEERPGVVKRTLRSLRRWLERYLYAHQLRGHNLSQSRDQSVEQFESFRFVFVQRISLRIAAPTDHLPEVV